MRRKLVFLQTTKKRDTLDALISQIDDGLKEFDDVTFERTDPFRLEHGWTTRYQVFKTSKSTQWADIYILVNKINPTVFTFERAD